MRGLFSFGAMMRDLRFLQNGILAVQLALVGIGAVWTAWAEQDPGLSSSASVRQGSETGSSHLSIRLEQAAEHSPPAHLSIRGKGPAVDLRGLGAGSRLGRVTVESSDGDRLDLEMLLSSASGANRCDFEIRAASAVYADLPAAHGTLENISTGFEMEIRITDWLVGLSQELLLPQSLTAEIDLEVPLRPTAAGDLSLTVKRIR